MKLKGLILAVICVLLASCAQLTSSGSSPAELARARKIFVEERLNDNLGIDRAIVTELRSLGYEADRGPLTMMPESAQLIVTYDARETWDFRPYLIELNLAVRPAQDYNRVVASSRYVRPGVTNKSPEAMVREALGKLFTAVN
jgi:hypothetical protein